MNAIPAFDPAPFIRTFEHSVDTLLEVRKDVQEKKEALESSLRTAERDFSRRLTELNTGFDVGATQILHDTLWVLWSFCVGSEQVIRKHGREDRPSGPKCCPNRYASLKYYDQRSSQ